MVFDTATMVVMIFVTNLVMMAFAWIVGFNQALPGLGRYVVLLLGNAVIYVVIFAHLQFGMPDGAYVLVINALFSAVLSLQLFAVAAFRQEKLPRPIYLLPVALALLAVSTLLETEAARKMTINLILVTQEFFILRQLLRCERLGSGRHIMIAVTGLVMADFSYRAIVALFGGHAEQISVNDPMNAVTYLVMFLTVVIFSFGFMLASFDQERSRMQRLQREQDLRLERERFSRELHDGLGCHLAALSILIGDGGDNRSMLAETVEQALLDMRMIMDGIGDECLDVGMTLGMLRHRLQSRLKAIGIDSAWTMDRLPVGCLLPEGGGLHLMRILQEALTNVARHSGANRVEVHACSDDCDPTRVRIEVIDNGRGLDPDGNLGYGLSNMKNRATSMGGALEIATGLGSGTTLTITLPITLDA